MNIESEQQLSQFVDNIDWEYAFIKEVSVVSPTFYR